jgi:fluoride exporter
MKILAVFLGSAVGGVSRYGVGFLVHRYVGDDFPLGTLAVNVLGCLIVGFLATAGGVRFNLTHEAKLLLITGFCGGFTTFSAFILETEGLIRGGAIALAVAYVVLTLAFGIGAFLLGSSVGRLA